MAGKVYLHKYYLHVTIDDDETKEVYRVHVPSSVYNDVEISDGMQCIIYYDEEGIFDIQLWEPGLAEENDYE